MSVAVISCGRVKTPSNGAKNDSSPLLGTVVTFSCNDGFRLEGSVQRICMALGKWSGTDVNCVGEYMFALWTSCILIVGNTNYESQ